MAVQKIKKITPFATNPSKWYLDVVHNGNLIAYGPFKGSVIFKPLAYSIWENIQKILDKNFKKLGVKNVYMPLLIPESSIKKEQEHVKGFAPELATITQVGGKILKEKLHIRPTSETVFTQLFAEQLSSYQDLPLLYNQWVNVLRWEKNTTPFLRTSEFLWQEGHTCHFSREEAWEFAKNLAFLYKKFLEEYLAIPTYFGAKTERERFSGAEVTFTLEAMMRDGKALQSATSHVLGQNFSKAFDITFKDKNNQRLHPFQTSWGLSTRVIGGMIMCHGDDRGIVIPPKIAQKKVDVVTINPKQELRIKQKALQILSILNNSKIWAEIDDSAKNIGFKAAKSEISGTPLRIEIGKQEIEEQVVTLIRRDTLEKKVVSISELIPETNQLLEDIQKNLLDKAQERLEKNTVHVENFEEFQQKIREGKFVSCYFLGTAEDEAKIQEKTGATARVILDETNHKAQKCIWSREITQRIVIFARAY